MEFVLVLVFHIIVKVHSIFILLFSYKVHLVIWDIASNVEDNDSEGIKRNIDIIINNMRLRDWEQLPHFIITPNGPEYASASIFKIF